MMMSVYSMRRPIVCLLLMVVLSNARNQQIPNSSSAISIDTHHCSVESLESRLSTMEDQLNRMLGIISTLNSPSIKENCTVDLASYGYDDSTKHGYVRTSGGSSADVIVFDERGNHRNVHRGVTLFELDITNCITRNRQRFDTYAIAEDRTQFLEALESATAGTIIIGVTADTPELFNNMTFQAYVGLFFTRYNMNLTGLQIRDKFAFIMQKGYPKKTVFQRKPRYGDSLRMKVAVRGSSASDVTFSRVQGVYNT